MREPRSDYYRYAYGYLSQRPSWSFWIILLMIVLFDVYMIIGVFQ